MIDLIIKYIKEDQSRRYALLEEVSVTIEGKGVGAIRFRNEVLQIEPNNDNSTTIIIQPFGADTHYWNGADILPENLKDGSFEASLFHDLIWVFSAEIAEANNVSEQDVLRWSNGIMIAVMRAVNPHGKSFWQSCIYNTLEIGRRFYKPFKKLLKHVFFISFLTLTMASCKSIPDWYGKDLTHIRFEENLKNGN